MFDMQASPNKCWRLQRVATFAAVYNSELNVTTLQQTLTPSQRQLVYPTDGSNFGPCEWRADDQKSATDRNRFGKTYAEMKQAITAAPPMNGNEKRILLAIAMQESDNMDSTETGEPPKVARKMASFQKNL